MELALYGGSHGVEYAVGTVWREPRCGVITGSMSGVRNVIFPSHVSITQARDRHSLQFHWPQLQLATPPVASEELQQRQNKDRNTTYMVTVVADLECYELHGKSSDQSQSGRRSRSIATLERDSCTIQCQWKGSNTLF